jgi:hypothetical protein
MPWTWTNAQDLGVFAHQGTVIVEPIGQEFGVAEVRQAAQAETEFDHR